MVGTGELGSPAPPAERTGQGAEPVARKRRRILVVDDHRDAARVLALLLDALGYDVETAHDGHQALAAMSAFHPEIVFLDIGLPQIDGYEVARRVRELPALDGIKLVALTGWGHDQDRCRTREAGFDHHLVKPVAVKTLKELLARA